MNDFDRAMRYAVKADPEGTLRWVFPKLSPRWHLARWFDAQSAPRPGEPDRRCDTIAELTDTEGTRQPRAVILELFADPDADADDRLLEYIGRYRRELRHGPHGRDRYPFLAGMIFLANGPQSVGWSADLPDEAADEVGLNFRPRLLCVDRESAVATLDAIGDNRLSTGILAWVPAMSGGDTVEVAHRWRDLVRQVKDDNQLKTLCDLAILVVQKTGSRDLWKRELGGFPLDESISMREVRLETRRADLLEVLESRFPEGVPGELRDRIQQQADAKELARWFTLALKPDLAPFRAAVGA
jgi:hypothetical protein